MSIELEIQNPSGFNAIPSQEDFQTWVDAALIKQDQPASVVLRIVNEAESQALNRDYRHKNAPTNVLSFPFEAPDIPDQALTEEPLHLGDLVLCAPIIEQEAQQQHKTPKQHWAHMVVHGLLHLQGHDHLDEAQAKEMESLEISLLQQLDFPNPYEPSATLSGNQTK